MAGETTVENARQRYGEEAQKPRPWPSLRLSMEAKRLDKALLYISPRACEDVFKAATRTALELIERPYGMTQTDRIAFNLLLSHGLPPDSCDGVGKTLLMEACEAGDLETVITLRNRGARKDPPDVYGADALAYAERGARETKTKIINLLNNDWKIPPEPLTGPKPNDLALRLKEPNQPA